MSVFYHYAGSFVGILDDKFMVFLQFFQGCLLGAFEVVVVGEGWDVVESGGEGL